MKMNVITPKRYNAYMIKLDFDLDPLLINGSCAPASQFPVAYCVHVNFVEANNCHYMLTVPSLTDRLNPPFCVVAEFSIARVEYSYTICRRSVVGSAHQKRRNSRAARSRRAHLARKPRSGWLVRVHTGPAGTPAGWG